MLSSQFPNVGRPDMGAVFAGQNYIPDKQPTWVENRPKIPATGDYNFQSTKN